MNQTPDDKALNEYLSGQSPISARYRELPTDDVPPELDAAILAQAKSAVANSSSHSKLERWRRWTVPTTLAATFVLVVSLVIQNQMPQAPEAALEEMAEKNVVTVDLWNPNVMQDAVQAEPVPPPPKLETPPPYQSTHSIIAEAIPMAETDAVVGVAPQQRQQPTNPVLLDAPITPLRKEIVVAAPPPATPAPVIASAPILPTEDSAKMAKAMERRSVANQMQAVSRPADSAQQMIERREADPKLWLEYIRELRKENKTEDANREWENFRKRYPDFKIEANDVARGSTP